MGGRPNEYRPFLHALGCAAQHLNVRKGAFPRAHAIAGGGGRLQGTAVERAAGEGRNGRAVMNSIISEKRFAFVALPVLLATLALFYVLGAAALFAEAAQAHQDMARHGRSELVSPVIEIRG